MKIHNLSIVNPKKLMTSFILASFLVNTLAFPAGAQILPASSTSVVFSAGFQPPLLLGLKIHPENPLLFDFIVDQGSSKLSQDDLKFETEKLVKYFLAALTIPDKEVWVNLSPVEKDRIIPDALGQTMMGKTMLEQDYLLKQLASSLTNPETKLGKEYWQKAGAVPTLSKVWIVPEKAEVLESNGIVLVGEKSLKVRMEDENAEIFQTMILPTINKEVNENKDFADVRQIYNSVILATWYKQALKESLLGRVYTDKGKVAGIETDDKEMKKRIYEQYLAAFKKGAYNLIKEELDSSTGDMIPRKYFSGGISPLAPNLTIRAASPLAIQSALSASSSITATVRLTEQDEPRSASSAIMNEISVRPGKLYVDLKRNKVLDATGFAREQDELMYTIFTGFYRALLFRVLDDTKGRKVSELIGDRQVIDDVWITALSSVGTRVEGARELWDKTLLELEPLGLDGVKKLHPAVKDGIIALLDEKFIEAVRKELKPRDEQGSSSAVESDQESFSDDALLQMALEKVWDTYILGQPNYEGPVYYNATKEFSLLKEEDRRATISILEGLGFQRDPSQEMTRWQPEVFGYQMPDGHWANYEELSEVMAAKGIIMPAIKASSAIRAMDKEFGAYKLKYDLRMFEKAINKLRVNIQLWQSLDKKINYTRVVLDEDTYKQIPTIHGILEGDYLNVSVDGLVEILEHQNLAEMEHHLILQDVKLAEQVRGFGGFHIGDEYFPEVTTQAGTLPGEGAVTLLTINNGDRIEPTLVLIPGEVITEAQAMSFLENTKAKKIRVEIGDTAVYVDAYIQYLGLVKIAGIWQDLTRVIGLKNSKSGLGRDLVGVSYLLGDQTELPFDTWEDIDAMKLMNLSLADVEKAIYDSKVQEFRAAILQVSRDPRGFLSIISLHNDLEVLLRERRKGNDVSDAYLQFIIRMEALKVPITLFDDIVPNNQFSTNITKLRKQFEALAALSRIFNDITDEAALRPPPAPYFGGDAADFDKAGDILLVDPKDKGGAASSAVGGINFDPTNLNLQIKRNGQGVPLPLPQQNLEQINIQGLFPVIINIQPINAQTLPVLLGQGESQDQLSFNR